MLLSILTRYSTIFHPKFHRNLYQCGPLPEGQANPPDLTQNDYINVKFVT